MLARDAALRMGGGPWYGYWYGVILEVVEGVLASFRSPLTVRGRHSARPTIGLSRADRSMLADVRDSDTVLGNLIRLGPAARKPAYEWASRALEAGRDNSRAFHTGPVASRQRSIRTGP
jgi:hypothetical protein